MDWEEQCAKRLDAANSTQFAETARVHMLGAIACTILHLASVLCHAQRQPGSTEQKKDVEFGI